MNTTEEEMEFDYQAYMKDYAPNPDNIHWGLEARQKRREAAIHNNRGIANAEKEDYDRAIVDFTKAIKLNPDYVYAYYNRSLVYREKEDYDRAIADFTKTIELKPNFAKAYTNRAVIYQCKGLFDCAITDHTKAIELNPDLAQAYINRGAAYGGKRRDRSRYCRLY